MKLEQPIKGDMRITQKFKANPSTYKKFGLAGHDGVDYGCPMGTSLFAPMAGEIYVGWAEATWGLFYSITNDWGTCYLCHLLENFCPTGSKVTKGQLIGKTNNTGNSTGPHLHIGLRVKGLKDPEMKDFVDPLPYFQEETEEKIYTEKEMTKMRLERDKNWTLYLDTSAKAVAEIIELKRGMEVALKTEKALRGALVNLESSRNECLEKLRAGEEVKKMTKDIAVTPKKGWKDFYSPIKKVVWRFVRVTVDGGAGAVVALLAVPPDLSAPKKFVSVLISAFVTGALAAVFKYLRERADSYEARVHKLPF